MFNLIVAGDSTTRSRGSVVQYYLNHLVHSANSRKVPGRPIWPERGGTGGLGFGGIIVYTSCPYPMRDDLRLGLTGGVKRPPEKLCYGGTKSRVSYVRGRDFRRVDRCQAAVMVDDTGARLKAADFDRAVNSEAPEPVHCHPPLRPSPRALGAPTPEAGGGHGTREPCRGTAYYICGETGAILPTRQLPQAAKY
ncbi:hypothetical protein BU17DRAFT_59873 [Hysterangium stoloniferum]|nr:hypothetical protein BU17DRAFT_59873 [Hysterangium stoloniferum]